MRIDNYIDFNGDVGISGLFYVSSSFGIIDGNAKYSKKEKNGNY